MRFICLGYADMSAFDSMTESEAAKAIERCFDYDDVLRAGGHFAGGEALDFPSNAVTLRMCDGQVQKTDGPFAETKEQIGGILILEAENMEQAVELMSEHPGVAMGAFEIRPADDATNAMVKARDEAFRNKNRAAR